MAITAFDLPPLGSGTSKAIRKIGRFGWLSWPSGWEADSTLLLAGDVLGPAATAPYIDHVLQANRGTDLDFLFGASGHEPPATTTDRFAPHATDGAAP